MRKEVFSETASGKEKWVFSHPIHKSQGQVHKLFYGFLLQRKKILFLFVKRFHTLGKQKMFSSEEDTQILGRIYL